ncbi:MAG TPA: hypothetical protein VK208_15135 [Pyrinomonadaceae bacterium]|nr:hypothetical protein [Pyrinomonadaceae bacterium]
MAKAKDEPAKEPVMSREEAAEVFRQIRKRDEFAVKALDALTASITVESELAAKQKALGEITKEHETAAAKHAETLKAMEAEQVEKLKGLQKSYDSKVDDLKTDIAQIENRKAKIAEELSVLQGHIEVVKKDKQKALDDLRQTKIEIDKESEAYKQDKAREKKQLEDELQALRSAIKVLRGTVEQLPATGG